MIRTIASASLAAFIVLAGTPVLAAPADDVRNAMIKLTGQSSYEMTFSGNGAGGTMDIVKPDAMHMRMQQMEMVRVNNVTYVKAGPRGWMKVPDAGAGPIAQVTDRVRTMTRTSDAFTATDLGMKMVGGRMLHAYGMVQKDKTKSTVYIGGDGMIHRIEGSGNDAVSFSKFNQIAPIRAPM